jgi:hypothetical protein
VIVGQVAAWLLLVNVTLPTTALDGLSSFLGAALTAIYYVGVRVLEQQWPWAGVLLGLSASPDTYSKSAATNVTVSTPAASTTAVTTGPGTDVQSESVTPAAVIQVKPQTAPDLAASTAEALAAATPAPAAPYPTPGV